MVSSESSPTTIHLEDTPSVHTQDHSNQQYMSNQQAQGHEEPTEKGTPNQLLKKRNHRHQFNPRKYALIYEEAIHCVEMRKVFQDYLRMVSRNEEPILFLNAIDEYSEEYKRRERELSNIYQPEILDESASIQSKNFQKHVQCLYEKLKLIIERHVKIGSMEELNLGSSQMIALEEWNEITKVLGDFSTTSLIPTSPTSNSDSSSTSSYSSIQVPTELLKDILGKLHPKTGSIISQLVLTVHIDLTLDQFPRFTRSEMALNFLKQKGEHFVRGIAIDISRGYNVDLRFKPKDLKERGMHDNHIYFGFTLAEDTPDWKALLDRDSLQVYTSKTPYVFNKESLKGMKLLKMVANIPYSFEDVYKMWCHGPNHVQFDKMTHEFFIVHNFIPPNENCKFAQQICSTDFDMKIPLFKKRHIDMTATTILDPSIDMFMFVLHSTEFSEKELPTYTNKVNIEGLIYYMFFKVNNNNTRFVNVLYSDLKLPIGSDTLTNFVWKSRAESLKKGIEDVMHKLTDGGKRRVDDKNMLDDQFYVKSIEENSKAFPNRSWYKEWIKINEKSPKESSALNGIILE